MARNKVRERMGERSVFIKRICGRYFLYIHKVTEKQQRNRDLFAQAQAMAKEEMKSWNRRRHWERMARRHKVKGGRRMAISVFCKILRESEGNIEEARVRVNRGYMRVVWNEAKERGNEREPEVVFLYRNMEEKAPCG